MRRALIATLAAAMLFGGSLGAGAALVGAQGEGHTPVVVCHWVPAHGGSYVQIVVDDDGANGNRNLRAHEGHENDVISPAGGACLPNDVD